jgi:sugar phosphate isomerase/epimerase
MAMSYTRRDIGKLALAGLPGAWLVESTGALAAFMRAKPDSEWAGVQVGMNVPYNFGGNTMSSEETLKNCVELGLSAVELRGQPVEGFLGIPADLAGGRGPGGGGGARGGPGGPGAGAALTPEQQAEQQANAEALRKWRTGVSMDKVKAFRKMYEDAGVKVRIARWDGVNTMSDDEVDYVFTVSKALGASAIAVQLSNDAAVTKRIGQFAEKHKMMAGYHNEGSTPTMYDAAFASSKYNGANLDIGHLVEANIDVVPFVKKVRERITHLHIKDHKLNHGPSMPFGQGDTPIKEVLRLVRDSKWDIPAIVEFSYHTPEGSTRMAELAKTLEYCKQALLG